MLRIHFLGKPVSRPDRLCLEVLDVPDHCVHQFQKGMNRKRQIFLRIS